MTAAGQLGRKGILGRWGVVGPLRKNIASGPIMETLLSRFSRQSIVASCDRGQGHEGTGSGRIENNHSCSMTGGQDRGRNIPKVEGFCSRRGQHCYLKPRT